MGALITWYNTWNPNISRITNWLNQTRMKILKVSKFQKQILLFSFESKTERNYFLISAMRTWNYSAYSQNNKCQKYAGIELNDFISEKKKSWEPFGIYPLIQIDIGNKVPSFSWSTHY